MTTGLYDEIQDERHDPLPVPRRALAIGAHPDDIEFGAGGTLARWAAAGCEVTMLVVTDGSKGTWDRTLSPQVLVAQRKDEQLAAAKVLGAAHVIHLDLVDGELVYSMGLRAEMCRQVRLAEPDVVLTHDPWQRYQLHPDHRTAGLAVIDGVVAARDHLFFPEQGLGAHRPDAILLWSADEPDHWEDISRQLSVKLEALMCHSSQATTTMGGADRDELRRQAFVDRVSAWAAESGAPVGLRAAEAFKRLTP
jgi:LmbE family N-acetylglucosaminyl deacetylase